MFNIFQRRIQKYLLPIKIFVLLVSGGLSGFIVYRIPPDISPIVALSTLLELFFLTLFSFFLSSKISFLLATALVFLLFLKAVSLLSLLNVVLLAVFIALLGLYLRKK